MKTYNWGIIGTGLIAHEMAKTLQSLGIGVYAVYNRNVQKAEKFAAQYDCKRVYRDCAQLLADDQVHIVYIATPHNAHATYIMQALQAGKHVLAEKSITVNAAQLEKAVALAQQKGCILAEAMTVYHMPLMQQLPKMIEEKIGKCKAIQINFGTCKPFDAQDRFYNAELAGGALLDLGVYALACMRMFCKNCPTEIRTMAQMSCTGVDETSHIILREGELLAGITLSLSANLPRTAIISGESGYVTIENYTRPQRACIHWNDGKEEVVEMGETARAMEYEVLAMQKSAEENRNQMFLFYSQDVMQMMTEIRNQWGFRYAFEGDE